jgi:hypothetical protein
MRIQSLWIVVRENIFNTTADDVRDAPCLCPLAGIPPPHRYIGIIGLAGICDLIYGAHTLTGKILRSKDLRV